MSSQYMTISIENHSLSAYSNAPNVWVPGIIGTCTGVAPGVCADFTLENLQAAGCGPAANCAKILLQAGAPMVTIIGAAALASETLTPAKTLAVVRYNTGTPSTGVITVTGTPIDSFWLRLECIGAGTGTVAAFRYSLDDGQTFVGTFTGSLTPTLNCQTGASTVSSGLSLTLTAATFDVGDVFSYEIFAPQIDTTDATTGSIASSFTAMRGDGYRNLVVIANVPNFSTDSANATAAIAAWGKIVTAQTTLTTALYLTEVVFNAPMKVGGTDEVDTTFLDFQKATKSNTNFGIYGVGHVCQASAGAYNTWVPTAWLAAARWLQNANPIVALYKLDKINPVAPGLMTGKVGLLRTYTGLQQYGTTFDEQKTVSGLDGWAAQYSMISVQSDRMGPNVPIESNFYFSNGCGADALTSDFYESAFGCQMVFFIPSVLKGLARWRGAGPKDGVIPKSDGTGQLTDATIELIEDDVTKYVLNDLTSRGYILPPGNGAKYISLAKLTNVVAGRKLVGKAAFPAPAYIKSFQMVFSVSI